MGQLTANNSTKQIDNQTNGVDTDVWSALKNILYRGAEDESIKMVLNYCRAKKLDPMQKPVHIVPMFDKKTKCLQDTIMPGIGMYRIQASRTNQYAGLSEPEYGKTITTTLDKKAISYPEWCKITVKKLLQGTVVEFTVKEYWLENYATKDRHTTDPNYMWGNRPFAQLAKCAEAQALRKAFPELIPDQPTMEEMEGKDYIEHNAISKPKATTQNSKLDDFLSQEEGADIKEVEGQIEIDLASKLSGLLELHNVSQEIVTKWCKAGEVDSLNKLDDLKLQACINYVVENNQTS